MYTPHKLFAVSVILGESLLSFTGDEVSALYKYMPPTPRIGSIASTKTTIPIPPSHWSNCLYRRSGLLRSSMFVITVAPVVVHPDVDSKIASTKLNSRLSSNRNGIAPKILKTNQNIATIKNPSRILICDLSFYLESMQGGLQKK